MTENGKGNIEYFAKQQKIHPKRIWGRYRKIKWVVIILTLGVYYFSPFIRWNRGGSVPDQAILIDLNDAKAYFFQIEIWPQEVYILTGVLIFAAILLFLITSILGRVWCGYLCPQTVWTDLFVWVERLVQGDRNARIRLKKAPVSLEKIVKITITHSLWLIISLLTGGAFVMYFNDAPTLIVDLFSLEASQTVVFFMAGLTFSTYIMAGFAREQVCTHMCPYARFQSAMFDVDTLIVGYDEGRGEERGKHKEGDSWEGRGHCIDCTVCVQVCPVGIDIRDGLQMECIACGLCVDACNDVMDRIALPRGLIRYDTTKNMDAEVKDGEEKFKFFRMRSIYYISLLFVVSVALIISITNRELLELHVLHDRNPLFVTLSSGDIRNGYTIKILNKTHQDRIYKISVAGAGDARIDVMAAGDYNADNLYVAADSVGTYHIFVSSKVKPDKTRAIKFKIIDNSGEFLYEYKSIFISKKGR